MNPGRIGRALALVVMFGVAGLALSQASFALTSAPVWTCRASAGYSVMNGGDRAETVVANGNVNTGHGKSPDRALCGSGEAGGGNLASPLGIPADLVGAATASAITSIDPELGLSAEQVVSATARVEDLTLRIPQGGAVTVGAAAADSVVTGRCSGPTPQLTGSSRVSGLTFDGQAIGSVDELVAALTNALSSLTARVIVKENETLRGADSLTVRALHVVVLRGSTTVVDAVIAESKVGRQGDVCGPPVVTRGPCPKGSVYIAPRNRCVIQQSGSAGPIDLGPPGSTPRGGTVLELKRAIKKYGNGPCLSGPGGNVVLVGTKKSDTHLVGGSQRDRILGLGGNDRATGARSGDCVDGGPGSDSLSGELGNDRLYGGSGNDHLDGGKGNDRLDGGKGNDTLRGDYGADVAYGGPGRDAINISVAGPLASAFCGGGSDKVRYNRRERKRIHDCETRYELKDK